MDRAEIVAALTALGSALDAMGVTADLYVVGGAAIALAYDERRARRDIDAVFVPKAEVWLNDAVKGFVLGPDLTPQVQLFVEAVIDEATG